MDGTMGSQDQVDYREANIDPQYRAGYEAGKKYVDNAEFRKAMLIFFPLGIAIGALLGWRFL